MNSSRHPSSRTGKFFQWFAPFSLLVLIFLSVLWKGGKTLESTWMLVFVMWLIVLIAFLYPREGERRVSVWLWGAIMLLIAWTGLSWFFSSVRTYGLDELLRTASLFILLLWTARLPTEARVRVMILRIFVVAVLIASIAGVAVYALQPANRFTGTFFDFRFQGDYWPNAWAECVLLAWPVLLYLLLRTPMRGGKFRHFLGLLLRSAPLGVLFGTLLLSYSRASIIAFAGQCVLFVMWGFLTKRHFMRGIVIALGSIAVAVSLFSAANVWREQQYPVQSLTEKALFRADEGTTSITERMQFWRQALSFANQKPLLGWGLGSFRFVQPRAAVDVLATSDHPHNVFLKVAMDSGWPAAVLWFLILGYILLSQCSLRDIVQRTWMRLDELWASSLSVSWLRLENPHSQNNGSASSDSSPFFLSIAVVGVLAHNMVDFNLQFTGIVLPFMLFLGVLTPSQAPVKAHSLINKCIRFSELILATFILYIALREVPYIVTSSLGRRAIVREDIPAAIQWFERSRGEWYSRDLYLTQARLLFQEKRLLEAKAVATVSVQINQNDARAFTLLTDIDVALKDGKAALGHALLAYRYGRLTDLGTMRRFLVLLEKNGKNEEIDQRKDDFDGIVKLFFAAIQRNTHYVTLSQNVEEFLQVTSLLSRWYPQDEPKYQVMAAAVSRIAKEERAKAVARMPGAFW